MSDHKKLHSYWLSILIPTYNTQHYLKDCIESILPQMENDIEIVFVDDFSTDDSINTISSYIETTPHNIKLIRHDKNLGLSAARNSALAASSGKHIWFIDSDDMISINAIEELKNIISKKNPDLIICDFSTFTKPEIKKKEASSFAPAEILSKNKKDLFIGTYKSGYLHAWSKISSRKIWDEDLKFITNIYYEDMAHTPKLLLRVNTFYYHPKCWYLYRKRNDSIVATPSLKKITDMHNGLSGVLNDWERNFMLDNHMKEAFIIFAAQTMRLIKIDLNKIGIGKNSKEYMEFKKKFYEYTKTTKLKLIIILLKNKKYKLAKRSIINL